MVFEKIEMRNPGFLFEDARHGYIQYISLSECYFAGKGAALVLPPNERARPSRRVSAAGCDIQQHLQSMFYLLRPEETLKMAVKLESVHPGRTRYLVVVSCTGRQDAEESCLLGIDCNERATVGLVLRVLADTAITLDGDGGFSVSVCSCQHIFKPVSVQAMWSKNLIIITVYYLLNCKTVFNLTILKTIKKIAAMRTDETHCAFYSTKSKLVAAIPLARSKLIAKLD